MMASRTPGTADPNDGEESVAEEPWPHTTDGS